MKYTLDGKDYNVEIIRKNNKNTYIRVKDDLIIYVTTPYFVTKRQILNLLDLNSSFLRKTINNKQKQQSMEGKVSFLGVSYDVVFSNLFDSIELSDGKIYIKNEKCLQKWCIKQAKEIFQNHYETIYKQFEEAIPYYVLKIRNMKTRWGVCNRKSKSITLNLRLIEYPLFCLDYVIIHELSHLVHFNHSNDFWKVVEKYCPDYKKIRKILKD